MSRSGGFLLIIRGGFLEEERPNRRDLHIAVIVCEIQLFFQLQSFHQVAEPILNIVSPCFGIDDGPKFDFEVPVFESSHPSLNVIGLTGVKFRQINAPPKQELDIEAVLDLASVNQSFDFILHCLFQSMSL